MIRILSVAIAFAFLTSSAFAQSAVEKGKAVYTAQKCSICHSIAGAGNKKGELDHVGTKLSESDLRSWITNAPDMAAKAKSERKPPMKAYTTLAKDEVDSLVAYLQTLK
jgi:mono/diheme cytochrome c family protein